MAQDTSSPRQRLRFGLHIHLYVGATILLLCVGVCIASGRFAAGDGDSSAAWLGAGSGLVLFAALLGLVAKYCTSEVLSYWDSIRLVSYYMSIGIGAFSLLFSFFFITAFILISSVLTLIGVVTNNRRFVQGQILRFLEALSKYRMHQ